MTNKVTKWINNGTTYEVPSKTSDLTNDSGFLTSDTGVTSLNGLHGDLVVNVPTKTSDLTNDSGFITSSDVLTKTNTTSYTPSGDYNPTTKKYVDDLLSGKQDVLVAGDNITISGIAGYTLLDYIESNGIQYINTEIAVDNNNSFELVMAKPSAVTDTYIVSQGYNSLRYNGGSLAWFSKNYHYYYSVNTEFHTIEFGYNYLKVDGTNVTGSSDSDNAGGDYVYIFAKNDGTSRAKVKVKSFKIYNSSNQLVFDGVAVRRNSDGILGLYDKVTNTLKTNGGTGNFTAGNDSPSEISTVGLQTIANLKTSLSDNSDSYYPSQKAVKTAVDAKANTSDVLTKTNTASYTPSANYHPATKKYVDDNKGTNVVYCTQSEYDALPSSKTSDGKVYMIYTTS